MPSLLVLHPSDEMYGADRVVLEVAKVALAAGFEVEFWLPIDIKYGEKLSSSLRALGVNVRFDKLPVLRSSYLNPRDLTGLSWRAVHFFVKATRRRTKFDLVYVNTSALALAMPASKMLGKRVIAHVHEDLAGRRGSLLGPLIGLADRIIVVSQAVLGGLPLRVSRRAEVIHNGFEIAEIKGESTSPYLNFLIASRWNSWKGHREFLAAWAQVERRDICLTILGGPPPAGASVDVVDLVSSLGDTARIEIVGEVDDAREYVARADIVVVPSVRPDPLPTIAIEAAGVGRPVLTTGLGGLKEIVVDGRTGWIVAPGDRAAWTSVIEHLKVLDVRAMNPNARRRFDEKFAIETFRRNIERSLKEEVL